MIDLTAFLELAGQLENAIENESLQPSYIVSIAADEIIAAADEITELREKLERTKQEVSQSIKNLETTYSKL